MVSHIPEIPANVYVVGVYVPHTFGYNTVSSPWVRKVGGHGLEATKPVKISSGGKEAVDDN